MNEHLFIPKLKDLFTLRDAVDNIIFIIDLLLNFNQFPHFHFHQQLTTFHNLHHFCQPFARPGCSCRISGDHEETSNAWKDSHCVSCANSCYFGG